MTLSIWHVLSQTASDTNLLTFLPQFGVAGIIVVFAWIFHKEDKAALTDLRAELAAARDEVRALHAAALKREQEMSVQLARPLINAVSTLEATQRAMTQGAAPMIERDRTADVLDRLDRLAEIMGNGKP